MYDLAAHRLTRLTNHISGLRPVGWTPDSRGVVFLAPDSATSSSTFRVVTQPWDGTAPPRELIRLHLPALTFTMGPPHGYAAFSVYDVRANAQRGDIWLVPLDTPSAARPFIATRAYAVEPRMSHDGQLLAYTSNESGRNEVYVRSLTDSAPPLRISEGGGTQPVWSTDDRDVYYRGPLQMMRANVARGAPMSVRRRDVLFEDRYDQQEMTDYDVFPSGKELLMIQTNLVGMHVGVVMDWPALLSQQAERR
ncbi:MAG TPA: hypothetical protein VGH98_18255 [Gemmatimonadaceae bacterium]